jgi:uncharacterized membrane protein
MKHVNNICLKIAALLLITVLSASLVYSTAQADEIKPQVTMTTQYPSISDTATRTFNYYIDIQYTGSKDKKVFNLSIQGPDAYTYEIQNSSAINIGAIELDPNYDYPETIAVIATPKGKGPKPGEYPFTLQVTSGDLKSSLNLKAVVTAKYALAMYTPDGLLNNDIASGKDNTFVFLVKNTGDSALENITFRQYVSGMPSGWRITFKPDNIEKLASNSEQKVEMNIKPSDKTIAGDYYMNVTTETDTLTAEDSFSLRLSVISPLVWTIIGIAIIVLVVAALISLYIFFGRR